MSNDKKTLPPKVAAFIAEAKPVLADYAVQVKRADDAEASVAAHAVTTDEVATAVTKIAEATADALVATNVISVTDRAKFASELVNPECAHNLIRNLGKRVVAAEASAKSPVMGNPADDQVKTASDEVSAHDHFENRLRQVSGL